MPRLLPFPAPPYFEGIGVVRAAAAGSDSVIGLKPYMRVAGGWKLPLAVWKVIGRLVRMYWLSWPLLLLPLL